ncbi:MAG: hypothetical protein AB7O56_08125 [Bauldia sp.]
MAPLWLLGDALEHLRPFVSELAGLHGRLAMLQLLVPPVRLATEDVARIIPALLAVLRDTVLHQVEDPMTRLCAGKAPAATVVVEATVASAVLRLSVRDDGVPSTESASALAARIGTLGVAFTDAANGARSLAMPLRYWDGAISAAGAA